MNPIFPNLVERRPVELLMVVVVAVAVARIGDVPTAVH